MSRRSACSSSASLSYPSVQMQDVFTIGERVRCLVMGMDDNFTRISLSTAELEENEGDIMFEKV